MITAGNRYAIFIWNMTPVTKDPSHKFHNASGKYTTMHHFVNNNVQTCAYYGIFATEQFRNKNYAAA